MIKAIKSIIKYTEQYIRVLFFGLIINVAITNPSFADDKTDKLSDAWQLSRGAQLYDNWAKTLNATKATNTHPSYPTLGRKRGSSTWRCKECHGWDYQGKDGYYKKGSHYTGIKGIHNMAGKSRESIKKIIRNEKHGYSHAMISDKELDYLALFVSKGQIDMSKYIDFSSKKVNGNVQHGANYFQTLCAVCHGFDGRKINFHDASRKPEYVGTVANKNPWELWHKIRSGQPGAAMISLRAFDIQLQLDILAYTQQLPTK